MSSKPTDDNGTMPVNHEMMKRRRKATGRNQRDLATDARVSPTTIANMEAGKSVTITKIHKVAGALGLTFDQLTSPTPEDGEDNGYVNTRPVSTDPRELAVDVGRYFVRITVARVYSRSRLRDECQKLAEDIYTYCKLLDGWDRNALTPGFGSAIFTMNLTPTDTKSLLMAFTDGALSQFDVTSITTSTEPPNSPDTHEIPRVELDDLLGTHLIRSGDSHNNEERASQSSSPVFYYILWKHLLSLEQIQRVATSLCEFCKLQDKWKATPSPATAFAKKIGDLCNAYGTSFQLRLTLRDVATLEQRLPGYPDINNIMARFKLYPTTMRADLNKYMWHCPEPRRRTYEPLDFPSGTPLDEANTIVFDSQDYEAIMRIPERDRRVVLRYFSGRNIDQIANPSSLAHDEVKRILDLYLPTVAATRQV